jgi:hypothetical protein
MKKLVLIPSVIVSLLAVSLAGPVVAAELLDVKPVATAAGVVVEVTADIPMTYTYYKVPGQARAVVDIADADPEKVEPLIVVNKGAVASISVDKAMIGDMTVSRLVFNLVAEADITVIETPDRKTLNVSFSGGKAAAAAPAAPAAAPAPVAVAAPPAVAPVAVAVVAAPAAAPVAAPEAKAAAPAVTASKEEEDPLGLDDPPPAATAPAKASAPAAGRPAKLEPVVPAADAQPVSTVVVKGVIIGATYIDIQTSGPVEKFKQLKLAKPERLSIEIPGTSSMKMSSVQVKRFGVEKVRIGIIPGAVRVVLDARAAFPKYEIVTIENGLRINFK